MHRFTDTRNAAKFLMKHFFLLIPFLSFSLAQETFRFRDAYEISTLADFRFHNAFLTRFSRSFSNLVM
jgi:hypothetical protein